MIITPKLLKEKFIEYNNIYFNSELPLCKFLTHESYKLLGKFSFRTNKWNKKITYKRLSISSLYDWEDIDLKNVIVHEMIHYYLAYKYHLIDGQLNHDKDFMNYAEKLNKEYGLKITVKTKCYDFKLAPGASKIGRFFATLF